MGRFVNELLGKGAWGGGERCVGRWGKVRGAGEGVGGEWYVAHRKLLIIHLRIVLTFATERTNL